MPPLPHYLPNTIDFTDPGTWDHRPDGFHLPIVDPLTKVGREYVRVGKKHLGDVATRLNGIVTTRGGAPYFFFRSDKRLRVWVPGERPSNDNAHIECARLLRTFLIQAGSFGPVPIRFSWQADNVIHGWDPEDPPGADPYVSLDPQHAWWIDHRDGKKQRIVPVM